MSISRIRYVFIVKIKDFFFKVYQYMLWVYSQ